MSADPEPLIEFTWSRWNRSLEAFMDFVYWGAGAFMATIALLQWQFPDWTPPQRGNPALVAGAIVGLLAPWYRFLFQYHTIRAYPDAIELQRGAGSVRFAPSEVIGLVARSGLNWNRLRDMAPEQVELIVWRSLVILTDFDRYLLPFDLIVCPWLYDSLREVCPGPGASPIPATWSRPPLESRGSGARIRPDRSAGSGTSIGDRSSGTPSLDSGCWPAASPSSSRSSWGSISTSSTI